MVTIQEHPSFVHFGEQSLYDDLRENVPGKNVRLEQERISYGHLSKTVGKLFLV